MSKKYKNFFLWISILCFFSLSSPAKAELDHRIQDLLVMSAYGTIGGALLGTASLAFDGDGRSVAKGASIGLYAGIVFGSYVVLSHYFQRQRRLNPEPDPYYDNLEEGEEESGGGLFGVTPNWQEYRELERHSLSAQSGISYLSHKKSGALVKDFYVPLLKLRF